MNTILKISLLASLCFSFNCIAALPSDPKQLSFEELANVVDNFQLRREDCQLLQLTAIANKFLNLKVNKKASSQQANPYRQLPAFFYSLPRGSLKTATVA